MGTAVKSDFVYIISTDCMHCGICEYMCPVGAIQEAKKQFIILKNVCNGCGDCVQYCPAYAIVRKDEFKERQSRTVKTELSQALE